jgi:hypothetical protein
MIFPLTVALAGGGAGGVLLRSSYAVSPLQVFSLSVGAGGAGAAAQSGTNAAATGGAGQQTVFGPLTAFGGGGGGVTGTNNGASGGGEFGPSSWVVESQGRLCALLVYSRPFAALFLSGLNGIALARLGVYGAGGTSGAGGTAIVGQGNIGSAGCVGASEAFFSGKLTCRFYATPGTRWMRNAY